MLLDIFPGRDMCGLILHPDKVYMTWTRYSWRFLAYNAWHKCAYHIEQYTIDSNDPGLVLIKEGNVAVCSTWRTARDHLGGIS